MSRQISKHVALLLIVLTVLPGCHPTQPFYFHEDGDLSHYLDKATKLEYPDVHTESLPDSTECQAPLTISNPEFKEMWDLTLEECISIALHNSKVLRNLGGVTPFGFADGLVERSGNATVFDPAIVETAPGGVGTGTLNSAVRANQIGGVESALADFDAQLSVAGAAGGTGGQGSILSVNDRAQNRRQQEFFPPVNETVDGGLDTRLTKKTATGARFQVRNLTNYQRWIGPVDATQPLPGLRKVPSDWTTEMEIRWDQPLLRGRGTMINRIPIMLARINEDISLASFEASVRNVALDLENTYWDLHRVYRNLETAKIGRDSAQVTWKIVYEKWNEGVEPVQAEAQAREQYFNFRAAVEQALQNLYSTETRLRWLMGLAATDGRLIRPIDEPSMARVNFEWTAIRTESLVRSPELRAKKWEVKQRELELISAKNQLLPQLDVGALYKWVGTGDDLINANSSGKDFATSNGVGTNAIEELTRGNYQEAAIIFNLALPVGFRRELAGVRNAQLRLAREKAVLEDQELNTVHLLTTAVRNLDSNFVLAETHFNRWAASEKEVESVEALYRGGKQTLDLVLDAQKRRAQAQVEYYNSLIEYNKAIAEVHFRKGSLLEYNNIELAEGPWPQKAYWDALGRARERDASYYFNYGFTRPSVVSQGPVDGQPHMAPMGEGMYLEEVPAPQPTPANGTPAEGAPAEAQPAPDAGAAPVPGPVTHSPAGPLLNAPSVRTAQVGVSAAEVENPLRQNYQWGSLGLDPKPAQDQGVQQATFVTDEGQ